MLIDSHREYPTAFRTPLTSSAFRTPLTSSATAVPTPAPAASLSVRCHCGAIRFTSAGDGRPERCHCARCRRSSCSSFVASLTVAEPLPKELGLASRYIDTCSVHGGVERLFCGRCRSSLGSVSAGGSVFRLSLGCVVDESIPDAIALRWQTDFTEVGVDERALWWTARPVRRAAPAEVRTLTGGCSCGGCAFTCRSGREFQTQHCYCKLCRSLSGSVAQTWVPVRPDGFVWTASETLQLVRTTGHGQRHMCSRCGCTLSIVYDSQPDCIWPVAGALDDAALPTDEEALGEALCRSIHICCSMMQPWYRLPDDKLPRLKYAG